MKIDKSVYNHRSLKYDLRAKLALQIAGHNHIESAIIMERHDTTVNYRVKFKLKAMRDHSASRGLWGRNYAVDQITSIQKKEKHRIYLALIH